MKYDLSTQKEINKLTEQFKKNLANLLGISTTYQSIDLVKYGLSTDDSILTYIGLKDNSSIAQSAIMETGKEELENKVNQLLEDKDLNEKLINDILSFREDVTEEDLEVLDNEELLERYYSLENKDIEEYIDEDLKILITKYDELDRILNS